VAQVYLSQPVSARSEQGALVIHCADPRFQAHFHDFLRNALHLDRYALVVVPGGPQFLAVAADYLPKFSWVGWRWMKFLLDLARPERVILIGHDDCRWYIQTILGRQSGNARPRVEKDLRSVRDALAGRMGREAKVELYFARLEGDRAIFDTV